jgi:hypothetical protein
LCRIGFTKAWLFEGGCIFVGWNLYGSFSASLNGRDEPVSHARDSLDKARLYGFVFKDLANFSDCRVDAVVSIDKNFLPPDSFDNLIARDELAATLQKQAQQFEGDPFEFQRMARAAQFVGAEIEFKIVSKPDQIPRDQPIRAHYGVLQLLAILP